MVDELTLYEKILKVTPPWSVEQIQLNEPDNIVHVYVEYNKEQTLQCPRCDVDASRYDTRQRTWRHLDTCQYQTIVHCAVPRCRCEEHGVLQISVPWAEKGSGFTLLFESQVIDWLKEASINSVSRRYGLSWNAIDGILKRAVQRGLQRREQQDTHHLAVDEVSQRKGRRTMTIVSNHHGHVLDVQENRTKDSLLDFYKGLSHLQRDAIHSISMDMSAAYIGATLNAIPHAKTKICFDKFHVIKDLNEAVNAIRKSETKKVSSDWRQPLQRTRFHWLRGPSTLTADHQATLRLLKTIATKTARAWSIKQYAMGLWVYRCRGWAQKAWIRWYH